MNWHFFYLVLTTLGFPFLGFCSNAALVLMGIGERLSCADYTNSKALGARLVDVSILLMVAHGFGSLLQALTRMYCLALIAPSSSLRVVVSLSDRIH